MTDNHETQKGCLEKIVDGAAAFGGGVLGCAIGYLAILPQACKYLDAMPSKCVYDVQMPGVVIATALLGALIAPPVVSAFRGRDTYERPDPNSYYHRNKVVPMKRNQPK